MRGCNPRTNGGQTRTRTGSCKQPTTRSCRPGMRYSWPWTWTCLPLPSRQTPPRPQASPGQRPFLVGFGWVTLFFAFAAGLSLEEWEALPAHGAVTSHSGMAV